MMASNQHALNRPGYLMAMLMTVVCMWSLLTTMDVDGFIRIIMPWSRPFPLWQGFEGGSASTRRTTTSTRTIMKRNHHQKSIIVSIATFGAAGFRNSDTGSSFRLFTFSGSGSSSSSGSSSTSSGSSSGSSSSNAGTIEGYPFTSKPPNTSSSPYGTSGRKSSSYSSSSSSSPEARIRNAISRGHWFEATKLLGSIRTTRLPTTGRDVVYVVAETCRRSGNVSAILPLLSSIPLQMFDFTSEDDVMPLLSECLKTNSIALGYRIASFLEGRGVPFTAKGYSVLVKGFGQKRNEQMVDRLLQECDRRGVHADVVLLNTALDAYIRCDHAKKALALFDAVVSEVDRDLPRDERSSRALSPARARLLGDKDPQQLEALKKKLMRGPPEDVEVGIDGVSMRGKRDEDKAREKMPEGKGGSGGGGMLGSRGWMGVGAGPSAGVGAGAERAEGSGSGVGSSAPLKSALRSAETLRALSRSDRRTMKGAIGALRWTQ